MVIATLFGVFSRTVSRLARLKPIWWGSGGDFEEGVEVGGVIVEVLGGRTRTGMQRSV